MKKLIKVSALLGMLVTSVNLNTYGEELNRHCLNSDLEETINTLQLEYPEAGEYIRSIIPFCNSIKGISDEEYNWLIESGINNFYSTYNASNIEYQEELYDYYMKKEQIPAEIGFLDPMKYGEIVGNLELGIEIIKKRGCPHTAAYLEHAIVPWESISDKNYNPTDITHNNDEWAGTVVNSPTLFSQIEEAFYQEILLQGKNYGTISKTGVYAVEQNEWNNSYLSQKEQNERLDIFASLAHVNYTAMFTKNEGENSGYHAIVYISDTYDFEEMDSDTYDNFEIEFGNNYCYLAQLYGYIMPFKINIYYSFG